MDGLITADRTIEEIKEAMTRKKKIEHVKQNLQGETTITDKALKRLNNKM